MCFYKLQYKNLLKRSSDTYAKRKNNVSVVHDIEVIQGHLENSREI